MQQSKAGLSPAQLDSVEQSLGKKLPTWYRSFMMQYPEGLVTLGAPYNTVSQLSLPNSVEGIIRVNHTADEIPSNILYIGTNGSGDSYYVILDKDDGSIYLTQNAWPTYKDELKTQVDWEKSYSDKFDSIADLVEWLRNNIVE
jgi:hypothetical protein